MSNVESILPALPYSAVLSSLVWVLVAVLVWPIARRFPALHLATISLTVLAFLLLNLFTVGAIWGWFGQEAIVQLFAFLMGVQLTAGISALVFVRSKRQ